MRNHVPGLTRGPKNNRYFNIYSNNSQSYLNGLKAMKSSNRGMMSNSRRSQFKIPGMKVRPPGMSRGIGR
jgi:hypothetical protein